jgi:hypothetical protein
MPLGFGSFSGSQSFGRMIAIRTATGQSDIFKPSGTTRLLALTFNGGVEGKSDTYTVTKTGTINYPTTGGVLDGGYASNWSLGTNYYVVDNLSSVNSQRGKTFIAWYKGTQTNSLTNSPVYSVAVPIWGDPRNSVYLGLGVDAGKIAAGVNGVMSRGTTSVNTGTSWFCLAFVYKSNDRIDGYVNGTKEITNADASGSTAYNRIDYIGSGYAYGGSVSPTQLDGIQIYDNELTQSQIQEIYNAGL